MHKLAGVTIDWYDDNGETLLSKFPTAEAVPDVIKAAQVHGKEKLANEQFALIAIDGGDVLRKYACNDAGTTAMSVIYFMEHSDKLPEEAVKLAATNLVNSCIGYGILPPEELTKMAGLASQALKASTKYAAGGSVAGAAAKSALTSGGVGAVGGAIGAGKGNRLRGAVKGGLLGAGMGAAGGAAAVGLARKGMGKAMFGATVAGGGAAAGLGSYKMNKKAEAVDITGQRPKTKLSAPAPESDADYAVITHDGRRMYPIHDWDHVKVASTYWLEHKIRMAPEIRREYATKLASKAAAMGYPLDEHIKVAGAGTFATDGHVKACVEMRKVAYLAGSEERGFLDELFEKRASMGPDVYSECLRRFDMEQGFQGGWDNLVLDPWASTFGKEADTVVWEDGADRVTASQLHNLAVNKSGDLDEIFTESYAKEFIKDPVGLFGSLPDPQKRRMARLADDIAHSGQSEGQIPITADKAL